MNITLAAIQKIITTVSTSSIIDSAICGRQHSCSAFSRNNRLLDGVYLNNQPVFPYCLRWQSAQELLNLFFAAALVLTLSGNAYAKTGFDYDVQIDVDRKHRALLENNLDIMLWRNNAGMDINQLRSIYARTPDDIRGLLNTEGYFNPRIEATLEQKKDRWNAHFKVTLGEPVLTQRFNVRIIGDAMQITAENSALIEKIHANKLLGSGRVFRQADWENAKDQALGVLLFERYASAKILVSQAKIDSELHQADLEVVLDSGPPFTFGELQITGLQRYPPTLVERLSQIKPGMPFMQKKLIDFQRRLLESNYFSSATAAIVPDREKPDLAPVRVEVVESPPKKLGFSVGYASNTGAHTQLDYRDLNIRGWGWASRNTLRLDTREQALDAEIQLPLQADGYRNSFSGGLRRTDLQGETTRQSVTRVKRSHIMGDIDTAITLQYQIEKQQVADVASNTSRALSLNYSWTQRRVDDLVFPSAGYQLNWQVGGASRALLSDRNFVRGYTKLAWFYPLGRNDNLMLRGEIGGVATSTRRDIPSEFLFRAGGDQSVRGYAYQSLGVSEGGAIVGGRYLTTGTVEYTHWFNAQWGAALFYDIGNAGDQWKALQFMQGYGVGARWRSPLGALKLDLAHGREVRETRLSFSIGFTF
jgi:translocation and assembly module TamA